MIKHGKTSIPLFPLFLVALALIFNLHALATDSFWGDEIFTATFASQSPLEVIRWTATDIHPPLYYLLAGGFTRLVVPLGPTEGPTPASDWLWRFPSVMAAVLTVAVTYRLAFFMTPFSHRRLRPAARYAVATAATLLLVLAPIVVKYGQEARMHALFMFLSALSTWLFFRALAKPRQWVRWLALALITTANLYTMYFGFLILAAQAAFLGSILLKRKVLRQKARLAGFLTATILAGLFYLPWWPVLFTLLRKRAAVGAIEGGVGRPPEFLRGVVRALGPMPEPVAWGFLLLFLIGLAFLARRDWPLAVFAGLWLALPVLLPIFLGDPRALQFRYAFVLPVYLIVVAYGVLKLSSLLQSRRSPVPLPVPLFTYFIWILATLSFIATLGIFAQTKPDWRGAAAYLDEQATPADIILVGPLWDEGRFIDYYYRGRAQLLTPAALVTNIERRAQSLRAGGGRIWAVNRFPPTESAVMRNVTFPGVVLSEPVIPVYEPALLTEAAIGLARQAAAAAYPWAIEAEAGGVLAPDPRTAQAGALRALGDTLVAAGRPEQALEPYQLAVNSFPGWSDGLVALAETQEATGNLPAAAKTYRQAVSYNLKWQGPLAQEAATLTASGQWRAALEKYHQIIE